MMKLYLKCLISSFIYSFLFTFTNLYFFFVETSFPGVNTLFEQIPKIITMTFFFSFLLYFFIISYKRYFIKIKLIALRAFIIAIIIATITIPSIILRYIYHFTKNATIEIVLRYTGIESLILFPSQIILLVPTIIFGPNKILRYFALLGGKLGIIFIPFIYFIISFIVIYLNETKIKQDI